jgi:ubiquinone/menaquinone biosynthesis C-methylase UbiE
VALNQFDNVARIYDPLVKLFFGKTHIKSQLAFINEIPDTSTVLILGGGTGDILVELLALRPACKVSYIEASEKMMSLAKNKSHNFHNVHFIHGTQESIPDQTFDFVITNFYFDLFAENTLSSVINKINKSLHINSQWLITDFVDSKIWWQRTMLKIMYLFFRVTCKIEAAHLPDWEPVLRRADFKKEKTILFFYGFIKSEIYCRKAFE